MAQFSVHKNKNPGTKALYPYLVDVQADLLSELHTRVVVPLAKRSTTSKRPIKDLTPVVEVAGETFVMLVPQLAGVALKELGPEVAVISQHRRDVVAALDFLITGI